MSFINKLKKFNDISSDLKQNIVLFHAFKCENVLFVTNDDKVFGYGNNDHGRLGFGDDVKVSNPQIIPELCDKNIKQFFIGVDFVLALSERKVIYGWGGNQWGQLGRGYNSGENEFLKPSPITTLNNKTIVEIVCHYQHCIALTYDGLVYGWGDNQHKQISGKSELKVISFPIKIRLNEKIKSIESLFAITLSGDVFTWGFNKYYNLSHNVESTLPIIKPMLVNLPCIDKIKSYYRKTYFLSTDGLIYFCGKYNKRKTRFPKVIEKHIKFEDIEGMNDHFIGLSNHKVFELKDNKVIETEFKSFNEYYCEKCQITYKTLLLNKEIMFKLISNYQIIETIGKGCFGEVLKVKRKTDSLDFAVKVIELKENQLNAENEVKILENIKNDFILGFNDLWTENKHLFICLQLFAYNLQNIIALKSECFGMDSNPCVYNPIDYYISSEIFRQLLLGLHSLHSLNPPILHRNLKPQNVLISKTAENGIFCKISDFGLTIDKNECISQTKAQSFRYTAPEVYTKPYNEKSDMYSLGMIAMDLFYFQNSSEMNSNYLEFCSEKYKSLEKIVSKMSNPLNKYRPNTQEVIGVSNQWIFSKESLDFMSVHMFKLLTKDQFHILWQIYENSVSVSNAPSSVGDDDEPPPFLPGKCEDEMSDEFENVTKD